jgi:hypothetical protein
MPASQTRAYNNLSPLCPEHPRPSESFGGDRSRPEQGTYLAAGDPTYAAGPCLIALISSWSTPIVQRLGNSTRRG